MKTSKIILFSYIGLLAAAFLVFVIFLSTAEVNPRTSMPKYTIIEKEVPEFKYIVADYQNISFNHSERINISAAVQNKDSVSEINYSHLNDTLYILPTRGIDIVTIHIGDISNITLINHNSRVFVNVMHADTLNYFATENSSLEGFNNSEIGVFNVDVSNANINAFGGVIGKLNLTTGKSSTNFTAKLGAVDAKISDNSKVILKSCNEMNIKKDDSSTLSVAW